MQLSKLLLDYVKEEVFNLPFKTHELIKKYPDLKINNPQIEKSASWNSIFQWHKFGYDAEAYNSNNPNIINGWKHENNIYRSCHLEINELKNFAIKKEEKNWACDIQQVECLCSSKSDLTRYKTIDDFALNMPNNFAKEISFQSLLKNLSHNEIRILKKDSSDFFESYAWDKRIILINSGGSHHFAAARLIAKKLKQEVTLTGTHYKYNININNFKSLLRKFNIFILPDDAEFKKFFWEAMKSFKATFYKTFLPRPYEHSFVIMLPKWEKRSQKISVILNQNNAFSFNTYVEHNLIPFCD